MKNTKEKSKFSRFFSNPMIGIISMVVGIVSLTLFYLEVKSKRELNYYCHPVKATVVKSGQTSALEVICKNEKIESDVTAAQVAIWNNGKKSIKRDDILETITLYTEPKTPIIEAVVRKQTREVIDLSIDRSSIKEGFIPINWHILEHNDGGIIQIIFAGSPDVEILAKGIIEGQKSIKQIKYSRKVKSPTEQIKSEFLETRLSAFVFLFLAIILIVSFFFLKRFNKKRIAKYKKKMTEEEFEEYKIIGFLINADKFLLPLAIVFFAFFIINMLMSKLKGPPFGF